jgi:hypothetical protein
MQLVSNTFGASLRKQGDRFLVQAGAKQLAVSAHKVQSILLTTGDHLWTDAIELASAHNIDLVFMRWHGNAFARDWQTKMGSTAAIRRRQLEAADGPEGLAFVRDWVQAKLRHQIGRATGVILAFFQTNHDGTFCLTVRRVPGLALQAEHIAAVFTVGRIRRPSTSSSSSTSSAWHVFRPPCGTTIVKMLAPHVCSWGLPSC